MKNRFKRVLVTTLSTVIGSVLIASSAVASVTVPVNRIGGVNRYETATKLATANHKTSDNVILVSGESAYDAISATVLAKELNAPILLTKSQSLDLNTKEALDELKVKNIYIVGGTGPISQSIRTDLKSKYKLIELDGKDRYATNLKVASYLVNELKVDATNVIMVGGENWADALSVAPVAAAKGQIILLGNNDTTKMAETIKFIKDNKAKTTIVGTTNVINNEILKSINGKRIDGGKDRFATNLNILNEFGVDMESDTTYIANATGNGFADALVASSAAGETKSPLVLIDTETSKSTTNALDYIKTVSPKTEINVLGGKGVITNKIFTDIESVVRGEEFSEQQKESVQKYNPKNEVIVYDSRNKDKYPIKEYSNEDESSNGGGTVNTAVAVSSNIYNDINIIRGKSYVDIYEDPNSPYTTTPKYFTFGPNLPKEMINRINNIPGAAFLATDAMGKNRVNVSIKAYTVKDGETDIILNGDRKTQIRRGTYYFFITNEDGEYELDSRSATNEEFNKYAFGYFDKNKKFHSYEDKTIKQRTNFIYPGCISYN